MTRKNSEYILKLYAVSSAVLILYIAYYFANHASPIKPANTAQNNKKYPVIGHINYLDGDVRLRMGGELLWLPAKLGEIIRDNDTVFTGSNGKLQIFLHQSTFLQVSKDSLVRVTRRNNLNTVHLEEGEVQLSSPTEDEAVLRVNDRSRVLKLTGVDEKVTYQGERQLQRQKRVQMAMAAPEEFAEAQRETFNEESAYNFPEQQPDVEMENTPTDTNEVKKASLDDETTKSFIMWLALGYGLFSLLAVKELVNIRKNSI
ncbi:hypothetical protein [Bdellovibrio sp. HCB209]|uniref:hypothetical protein n=1 Tax=Bdellovibrio sp. HCB209 TaxID=3394354 RepID=UPI0039B6E8AD